jgi:hypothetical protein
MVESSLETCIWHDQLFFLPVFKFISCKPSSCIIGLHEEIRWMIHRDKSYDPYEHQCEPQHVRSHLLLKKKNQNWTES